VKPATYTVGAPPHWRTRASIAKINHAFILALIPTFLFGAIGNAFGDNATAVDQRFGQTTRTLVAEMGVDAGTLWFLGILGIVALGLALGALVEYLVQLAKRQPYRAVDGHGALMGLLLVLLLPPSVPWWIVVFGVVIAIFLGKQIYGGIGGYPMHPVAIAWVILLISWPKYVYPVGAVSIAAPTTAAVMATVVGGLVLYYLGYIRPQITLGVLAGVAIFSLIFQGPLEGSFADQFLTGHVMLCAFFISTDATCSPANRRPMWVYGLGTGFLIVLIRAYGIWPDSVPFAVLLMNTVNPLLDRWRPQVRKAA
jgi:electron transport complex protein RnfD